MLRSNIASTNRTIPKTNTTLVNAMKLIPTTLGVDILKNGTTNPFRKFSGVYKAVRLVKLPSHGSCRTWEEQQQGRSIRERIEG